ncbi:MAG: mannitol-1-phosphate 5-dehydrogenase [Brevinema sp.]
MQSLLQIGAGNIGRACVGRLFSQAGCSIIFSDVNQELIALLNQKKEYYIHLVGKDKEERQTIKNIGVLPDNKSTQQEIFNEISFLTTAVGVTILPKIAGLIANIIQTRYESHNTGLLNIIACENTVRASSLLKEHVVKLLSPEIHSWINGKIAFPDAATDSIVPAINNNNPLEVTGEFFAEIIIDQKTFLGELPRTEGLFLEQNLDAYIERKLFTLNTGHAITAYLGTQADIPTIDQAIIIPNVRETVLAAMQESGAVLVIRYGFDPEAHESYIQKILKRFENPYLNDSTVRVGREPLRKLSYNDRLIKPLRGTIEFGLKNDSLLKGVQAAFQYKNSEDPDTKKIREMLAHNKKEALYTITGLHKNNQEEVILAEKIEELI